MVAPHPLIEYHALLEDGDLAASSAAALSDGQKAKATVVGRDGATDLAVLKIDAQGLDDAGGM